MALDYPNKMIALEDSLIHVGLTKKPGALALAHKNIGLTYMSEKGCGRQNALFKNTNVFA